MRILLVIIFFIFKCDDSVGQYLNTSGCEDIDGGGWQLVRHVAASANRMHPSTDNCTGSDVYGTYDGDAQSLSTWSIQFDDVAFNQYLFAFGDCSAWLVTTKTQANGEFYGLSNRCILASSENRTSVLPYYAAWYYRGNCCPEDPWISTLDHSDCRDQTSHPCMVYGENSHYSSGMHQYGFNTHNGGNVWIRNKSDENRYCGMS